MEITSLAQLNDIIFRYDARSIIVRYDSFCYIWTHVDPISHTSSSLIDYIVEGPNGNVRHVQIMTKEEKTSGVGKNDLDATGDQIEIISHE